MPQRCAWQFHMDYTIHITMATLSFLKGEEMKSLRVDEA